MTCRTYKLRSNPHTLDNRLGSWGLCGQCVASFAMAFSLTSCSGLTSSPPNNGQAASGPAFSLVVRGRPLSPSPNTNILSFSAQIVGVSLTPESGGSVDVPLNSALYQVDFTRLQSDTASLALSTAVAPGTYTNMVVSLANPAVTYCTQTEGMTGCATGSVVTLSGGPATPIIMTAPFPLTIAPGKSTGLAISVSIVNALTVNAQTQAVTEINLGAANVLTAALLPPTSSSLPPGALDFVEDITGVVSSVDSATQSVTVQTATNGAITAVAGPSTAVSPNCTTFNLGSTFACAKQGQVASLDTILNSDGTFTLLEYDPLGTTAGDWIEGVVGITPSSATQFQLVTNNFVVAPSKSVIGSALELGAPVSVSLTNPRPFVVDSKNLNVPNTLFSGATDASILAPGQSLAVHVVSFTPASDTAFAAASADFVYLRLTRVTGTVSTSAPPNTFAMQSFPSFFGLTGPVTVQLTDGSPGTNFDGVDDASALASEQTVSIRALYFGPPTGPTPTPSPFSAAKVRVALKSF